MKVNIDRLEQELNKLYVGQAANQRLLADIKIHAKILLDKNYPGNKVDIVDVSMKSGTLKIQYGLVRPIERVYMSYKVS